ncbi:hypothetical protein CKO15_09160 [Halorhodospira abdelmalekii]|nr:hypothetical protein [Halorhodospira abdelmalekii]
MVVLAAALAGCDGDDGSAGPPGAQGPSGETGAPGPRGPSAADFGPLRIEIERARVEEGELFIEFFAGDAQGRPYEHLQDGDIGATFAKLAPRSRDEYGYDWQNYIVATERRGAPGLYGDAFTAEQEGAALAHQGRGEYTLSYRLFENNAGSWSVTYSGADLSGIYQRIAGGAVDGSDLFWWNDGTALPQGVALEDDRVTITFDETLTHRVALELREASLRGTNATFDFIPANGGQAIDPASDRSRNIVANASCNSCHDRVERHGGIRVSVDNCVTCHNPGTVNADGRSPDFKQLVHRIHSGANLPSVAEFGDQTDLNAGWLSLRFPQGIADDHSGIDNCVKCHQGQSSYDALVDLAGGDHDIVDGLQLAPVTHDGDLWRVPSVEACSSCHDDRYWWEGDASIEDSLAAVNAINTAAWGDFRRPHNPGGGPQSTGVWSGCATACHQVDGITNDPLANLGTGFGPQERRDVLSAHLMLTRTMVRSEMLKPEFDALDFNPSTGVFSFDFRIQDGANGSHLTLTTDSDQLSGNPISFLIGWIEEGYADYTHSVGRDGGPIVAAPEWDEMTPRGDGWYEVEVDIGDAVADLNAFTLAVATQGTARGSAWSNEPANQYPQNAIAYHSVNGARLAERREVVDFGQSCRSCHQRLGQHGGNNRNDPVTCTMCHTPNRTDVTYFTGGPPSWQNPRLGNLGVHDNKYEESIDFKRMIHIIHASAKREQGVQIREVVYGGELAGHTHESYWPAAEGNCQQCHTGESYALPLAEGVIGSSLFTFNWDHHQIGNVGEGDFLTDNQTANLERHRKMSPTVSACSSCHDSASAERHMASMGGSQVDVHRFGYNDPAWSRIDLGRLDAQRETCVTCHGPGRSADVAKVHNLAAQ